MRWSIQTARLPQQGTARYRTATFCTCGAPHERDPIDVHVGQVIRRGRLDRGLSLERLALELGITYQQVQKYESGANRVSASMLYRIAAALDMTVGSFFPTSDADAAA